MCVPFIRSTSSLSQDNKIQAASALYILYLISIGLAITNTFFPIYTLTYNKEYCLVSQNNLTQERDVICELKGYEKYSNIFLGRRKAANVTLLTALVEGKCHKNLFKASCQIVFLHCGFCIAAVCFQTAYIGWPNQVKLFKNETHCRKRTWKSDE